jgi:putative hydrolase
MVMLTRTGRTLAGMSTPTGPGFGFGMDPDALRDAPLFRELQRVMAGSGGGPVNWELARQVGVATAAEAGADTEPGADEQVTLASAVRLAEVQVTARTGLDTPSTLASVRTVRRATWVAEQIDALRGLIEPAAARMTEAFDRAIAGQLPDEGAGAGGLGQIVSQLGPLLQGSQAGQVLGELATRAFAVHDVALPRHDETGLTFVAANLTAFERDWSIDPTELRTAIAVREVVCRTVFTEPWVRPHIVNLVDDFLATTTIDVDGLLERFAGLDPSDPDGLQRALGDAEDDPLFGAVLDDEQRLKLARVQAFAGAAGGYASHVTAVVGADLLGSSWPRVAEALRRYREEEASDPVYTKLLGIPIERSVLDAGRSFCDRVAAESDEPTLARMWAGAEALPSFPEFGEPTLWLARTL